MSYAIEIDKHIGKEKLFEEIKIWETDFYSRERVELTRQIQLNG